MISKIPVLKDILENSYGKSMFRISSPTLSDNKIKINADAKQSRAITHSFSKITRIIHLSYDTNNTEGYAENAKDLYVFQSR